MGKAVTIYPERFRCEPFDVAGFDRWQDAEGLLDAQNGVAEAWRKFSGEWKAARALDLRRTETEAPLANWLAGMDNWEKSGMEQARTIGGSFALCNRIRGVRPLTPAKRKAFRRWQARVIPHAPAVYLAQWPLLDGHELAVVAAWHGEAPVTLGRAVRLCWRWLADELYQQPKLHAGV